MHKFKSEYEESTKELEKRNVRTNRLYQEECKMNKFSNTEQLQVSVLEKKFNNLQISFMKFKNKFTRKFSRFKTIC